MCKRFWVEVLKFIVYGLEFIFYYFGMCVCNKKIGIIVL